MPTYRDFAAAGYRVFALHPIEPDGSCGCQNSECAAAGKHPAMGSGRDTPVWDDDQLDSFDEVGWMQGGYGVIVSDGLLVIDVDPRNGGEQGYKALHEAAPGIAQCGLIVETGRRDGGRHLYFRAPKGVALVQSLPQFQGVDFKSTGYVVGPGSMHASGHRYRAVVGDDVGDISDAPAALIQMLERPEAHRTSLAGDQLDVTDKELQQMIPPIDPDCPHDEWGRVGMALHEVTGGTGFDLWDEWSSSGKKYPGRDVLEQRWQRFGKSATRVGDGTLHKYATEDECDAPDTTDYTGTAAEND